jgi:hypothetical protein
LKTMCVSVITEGVRRLLNPPTLVNETLYILIQ